MEHNSDILDEPPVNTGMSEVERQANLRREQMRIDEVKKRQAKAKSQGAKSGWIDSMINIDNMIPSDNSMTRIINASGNAAAEQVMRTVGNPFDVKIMHVAVLRQGTTLEEFKILVFFHREDDISNQDPDQPPVGSFDACQKILASVRFPSALITYDNLMLDIIDSEARILNARGEPIPVVKCEAKLSDEEKREIIPLIETSDALANLLENHTSKIRPGFLATLESVLDAESSRSQGVVVISPYRAKTVTTVTGGTPGLKRSETTPKPGNTETNKEMKKQLIDTIMTKLILPNPQNRVFVSIHTQKENYRQIAAGPLYEDKGYFVISAAPFQQQITEEVTGGAFELKERVMDERAIAKSNREKNLVYSRPKYLILLSVRGYGLSPAVSNAIALNLDAAISQPLMRANDKLTKTLNDPDGPYRRILADVKEGVFTTILGIFALTVVSGVTTEAINQFFAYVFGIRVARVSKTLKQTRMPRLRQPSIKAIKNSVSKKQKTVKSKRKFRRR